jgi:hypothetical protein
MTAIELPKTSKTVDSIFANYKKIGDSQVRRGYLGASIIGATCERWLWYNFRFCCKPNFDGRMYRLFETGQLEEPRMIADLRAVGCEVHEVDPATGEQFEVSAIGGHLSGHMDGCVLEIPEAPKTWHVLECKTHSAKSFAKLKKEGVLHSKPQHYAQMQVYMGLTKMTRALYFAKNKDTDDLYSERVRFDQLFFDTLIERANRVISSNSLPERISTREDWYECSWCDAHAICWGAPGPLLKVPKLSCRQCCHATATMDGDAAWKCEKHRRGLSEFDQDRCCASHLTLPVLLTGAEVTEYCNDSLTFIAAGSIAADETFRHGGDGFSSGDLMRLSMSQATSKIIDVVAKDFGMEITSVSPDDIISRYPIEECEIVWKGVYGLLRENWLRLYGVALPDEDPVCSHCDLDYQATE